MKVTVRFLVSASIPPIRTLLLTTPPEASGKSRSLRPEQPFWMDRFCSGRSGVLPPKAPHPRSWNRYS